MAATDAAAHQGLLERSIAPCLKDRRVATLTSASLVAYYAAAARFHLLSGDHPVVALPAVALGVGAAVNLCVELDGISVSAAED